VSISPTFARGFFVRKFASIFFGLHFSFVLFWRKNISAKAARKILVKLTYIALSWSILSRLSIYLWVTDGMSTIVDMKLIVTIDLQIFESEKGIDTFLKRKKRFSLLSLNERNFLFAYLLALSAKNF
jgi:hypothetical protein